MLLNAISEFDQILYILEPCLIDFGRRCEACGPGTVDNISDIRTIQLFISADRLSIGLLKSVPMTLSLDEDSALKIYPVSPATSVDGL